MKKALLLLAIGLAVGYWLGFNDAQNNTDDIITRLVTRTGGSTRDAVQSNADRMLDSVERH
jgi:hypothetical protein